MTTWALVPIKRRALCKTRLASVLNAREREEFVRSLLLRVLATLRATPGIDHVAVVSTERDTIPDDVSILPDMGTELNSSLEHGIEHALRAGASTLLIVPADLPRLQVSDVVQMLSAARDGGIALAPDRHERGTNALCMRATTRPTLTS